MSRTISTAQEDVLGSAKYDVHLRVEVEDSTGGMVNLEDWAESARWNWNLDQPVPELTVTLARDRGPSTGQSLAPLDEDSTFNYNSTSGFASLVYPGREIHVYTAATTPGGPAPASSAMDFVFQGELDQVAWERSPIQTRARSKNMSRLVDRWIESSSYVYGNSTGMPIENVIEQILADWTDLSTSILLTTASPGFAITPAYNPDKQPVLDAVTTLAQLIGWNLHEVWSTASTSWRIAFRQPNRTASSSQATWAFGPQHYYDVRAMSVGRYDVRNRIPVIFGPSNNRQKVTVESTESQDDYGVQFMEFEEAVNSAIATSSEAFTLADSAVTDLKDPPATHEVEVPYWFVGELTDFLEFQPNGAHYTATQYYGIYSISHEVETKRHRTSIQTRGQPAAYARTWLSYPGGGNRQFDKRYTDEADYTSSSTTPALLTTGAPRISPASIGSGLKVEAVVSGTFDAPPATSIGTVGVGYVFSLYLGAASSAMSAIASAQLIALSASASTEKVSARIMSFFKPVAGSTTIEYVQTVTYTPPFIETSTARMAISHVRSSGTISRASSDENYLWVEAWSNSTAGAVGTLEWYSVGPARTL